MRPTSNGEVAGPEDRDGRATLSSRTRGDISDPHGPLQRLSGGAVDTRTCQATATTAIEIRIPFGRIGSLAP
jgi:hypothetical protein